METTTNGKPTTTTLTTTKPTTPTTATPTPATTLNFNVGVLGHIDSGKTSLAKALSTTASTACFDKNPQSRQRGITLDLGFSSFTVPAPPHLTNSPLPCDNVQFTLVDCPGHASLIKTIIGGAQIVDMVMLVVDVNKGFQTQTAECLVLSEIMASRMVVVMNKVDLVEESKRMAFLEKMRRRVSKTLATTKFSASPVCFTSANSHLNNGIDELVEVLRQSCFRPQRDSGGHFLFALDHCFLIKGQGTIMTGTVLSGAVSVNDRIEIRGQRDIRKVKGIQMYRRAVNRAVQGDRVGMCVVGVDAKQLERGLLSSPGYLDNSCHLIALIHKVSYFKGRVLSKGGKLHITVGHETQMGTCVFFQGEGDESFSFDQDYAYIPELTAGNDDEDDKDPTTTKRPRLNYVHIHLDHPLPTHSGMLLIASKLDSGLSDNACRIAFHGTIAHLFAYSATKIGVGGKGGEGKMVAGEASGMKGLTDLKVYKVKEREGVVDRKVDEYNVVCKGLFKKETNMEWFTGVKVTLSSGEEGVVEGAFGQSGKVKVYIQAGLSEATSKQLSNKSLSKKAAKKADETDTQTDRETYKVTLSFKKYLYDPHKRIVSL